MKKAILIICSLIFIGLIWVIRDLSIIKEKLGAVTFKPSIEEIDRMDKIKADSVAAFEKELARQNVLAKADSLNVVEMARKKKNK